MRNQKELVKEITTWAESRDDVRAIMLIGSRASPNQISDLLSDYDIEIVVNHPNRFLNNEEWLLVFGDILTIIRVDEDFSLLMVLYTDYVRIDFRIYSADNFKQYISQPELPEHWNVGYIVLSDKDQLTAKLRRPSYQAFIITKPSPEEFSATVTDFWWDTTYVAKSLWRKELFFAKYMSDNIIRFSYLQNMIEWYAGVQHNWQISTNKHGRFFQQFLDAETWIEVEKTFSGSDIEENWKSLFATIQLFRRLAETIAKKLHYSYPRQMDAEITTYLEKVRSLGRNETGLN